MSARQVTELRAVWRDLEREPDAATPPNSDDAVCPTNQEPVQLSLNGETVLLTLPRRVHLAGVRISALRLLDSYPDPAIRTVWVRRALRSPRTELHLSDGTVLKRHGRRRANQ